MELDHRDITALAEFFAKRFPDWRDRQELAKAARVPMACDSAAQAAPALEGWTELLERTSSGGAMLRLARAASRRDPGDENLQGVCRLLGGPGFDRAEQADGSRLALAALALIAAGLGAWAWMGRAPTQADTTTLATTSAEMTPSHTAPSQTAPSQTAPSQTVPSQTVPSRTASALTDAPVPSAELVAVAPNAPASAPASHPWVDGNPLDTPAAPSAPAPTQTQATGTDKAEELGPTDPTPAHYSGRCSTPDGGLVGYWYAGEASPGHAGQTIEMSRSVYVRADYPDTHNGYAHDAAVRCSLVEGDTVRLSADPILVPGDRYWVPIHSGDLVR